MAIIERDEALAQVVEWQRERDEARREADRFRHGCTVEGDFVCPNEYAMSELTAERNFLRALKKNHEEDFTRVCKERDEARAEVEKLSESAKTAWEAECVMRDQRDRYHAEWKQERQEVGRLRIETHDALNAMREQMAERSRAYRRGAEAMREACARWMSEREGISQWVYNDALSALPIPEEP